MPHHNKPCHDKPCYYKPCRHCRQRHDKPCHDKPCHDKPCHDKPCHDKPCHDKRCHDKPCHEYCPPPPTVDVYEQQALLSDQSVRYLADDIVLERVVDTNIPLAPRNDGVYGYDEDGKLVLNGGKLYSDKLTSVNYKISSVNPASEKVVTLDAVLESIQDSIKFYTARGFQIAPPDTFESNRTQFDYRQNVVELFFYGYDDVNININPYYTNGTDPLPSHLDILAINRGNDFLVVTGPGNYNPNIEERNVKFSYPVRVPLTTDKEIYLEKSKKCEPIVYYNIITQQLVFDVQNIDHLSFRNPKYILGNDTGNLTTSNVEIRMQGIQGKFQLSRRVPSSNEIVSSSFSNAQYLIQTSKQINVQCTRKINDNLLDLSYNIDYRTPSGLYSGVVASLLNTGSPIFDIKIVDPGFPNAYSTDLNPLITLQTSDTDIGDNSYTIPKELLGSPTRFVIFDSELFAIFIPVLSVEYLANPPIPEDYATYPLPQRGTNKQIVSSLNGHEYLHSIQIGLGLYPNIDGEGQATAIELDTQINLGTYGTPRPVAFTDFVTESARARNPHGTTDSEAPSNTYGSSMWWNWLAKTHDTQYQVMRRTNDIMTTEVAKTQAMFIETSQQTFNYYSGSNRLSQKQAIEELFGGSLNLSDLYCDFIISLSLLRNNSSIPQKYRSFYPYWTQQTDYPGAEATSLIFPPAAYWWSEFDTNSISAASAAAQGYEKMVPQLVPGQSTTVDLQDLSSYILVVDKSITDVTITRKSTEYNDGKFAVTMHQFTSGGPDNAGSFKIEGPIYLNVNQSHTFDVSSFNESGLIRLVVSNLSITDFGPVNNLFTTGVNRITGMATIDKHISDPAAAMAGVEKISRKINKTRKRLPINIPKHW